MILFCKLVCVYVHKICEDKFGGCKKSLGQKVKKNRLAQTWPHVGKTSQHRSAF